jgi:inner membrane protein
MVTFGALALAPDADVIGVALGLDYHGHYGHRGYTHSLLFAGTLAAIAFFVARRWGTRPWLTALLTFMAVGSHGVLDAMTYRTRGVPFFWPLTDERFTFPWRHIPPAPMNSHYLSRRGLEVAGVEMVYFLPTVLIAFAPSVAAMRRWGSQLAFWRRLDLFAPAPVPVPVHADRPLRRAAFRVTGLVAVLFFSMAFANYYLRDSRIVSWIEQSTQKNLAVSMMSRPQFRHLH